MYRLLRSLLVLLLTFGASAAWAESPPERPLPPPHSRMILIHVPSRTLDVIEGSTRLAHFPVGLGRAGFPTPIGQFKVIRMIKNPGWENPYKASSSATRIAPGANNPLGTRWIGFLENKQGEYGMHGTDRPTSVGKYASHGCVRMRIADSEKLFGLVQLGTPVWVSNQPMVYIPQGDQIIAWLPQWLPTEKPPARPTVDGAKALLGKTLVHVNPESWQWQEDTLNRLLSSKSDAKTELWLAPVLIKTMPVSAAETTAPLP